MKCGVGYLWVGFKTASGNQKKNLEWGGTRINTAYWAASYRVT